MNDEFEIIGTALQRFSSSTNKCLKVLIDNWKVVIWIKACFPGKYSDTYTNWYTLL